MKSRHRRQAALGVVVFLAGCAGVSGRGGPPPSSMVDVPTLRGTWTGTWGGTPVALVITEQPGSDSGSGVYFGPVQVLGHRAPSVIGVLTSVIDGSRVSAGVEGWLTMAGRGTATLSLRARPPDGSQQLTLTSVQRDRLAGRGESEFPWGPRGAVELARSTP